MVKTPVNKGMNYQPQLNSKGQLVKDFTSQQYHKPKIDDLTCWASTRRVCSRRSLDQQRAPGIFGENDQLVMFFFDPRQLADKHLVMLPVHPKHTKNLVKWYHNYISSSGAKLPDIPNLEFFEDFVVDSLTTSLPFGVTSAEVAGS